MNKKILISVMATLFACGCASESASNHDKGYETGEECSRASFLTICEGNNVKSCQDNGKVLLTPCPNGCTNGACDPLPTSETCDPRVYVPTCNGNQLKTCYEGVVALTGCTNGCANGMCTPPAPTPTDIDCNPTTDKPYCKGIQRMSCSENSKFVVTDCPNGCIDGECTPPSSSTTVTCNPANYEPSCSGIQLQSCSVEGKVIVTSCPYGCENKTCNPKPEPTPTGDTCDPANYNPWCDGNQRKSCSSESKVVAENCQYGCENNTCNPKPEPVPTGDTCDPANYNPWCDGNQRKSCSNEGKVVAENCQYGCENNACKDAPKPDPVETCTPEGYKNTCEGNQIKSCSSEGKIVLTPCEKSCADGACVDNYKTQDKAPSLASSNMKQYLGPTIADGGVNFAVFSANAERVEVLLFENASADKPLVRLPMKKGSDNIWTIFVEGIGEGQHYGYIAFGPNWKYDAGFDAGSTKGFVSDVDNKGNRFNPNKLLIDPYAKRLSNDFDVSKGSPNTGEKSRAISSWGAAPKSVVATSKYKWSDAESTWRANRQKGDAFAGHAANDLIYYEVHPKGFTKNAKKINTLNLTVSNPGTWRGIGEMAPYLKDLGINAIELMPVAEKQDSDTYWGYNTINYFAPDANIASKTAAPNDVMDEFKWMVDQLHQNDVEVVIDVVYGQTGEGGIAKKRYKKEEYFDCPDEEDEWSPYKYESDYTTAALYSFRGLDNISYYIIENFKGRKGTNPDCSEFTVDNAAYLNQTGVGNQTRANYDGPFKQLIFDSMHYWVEEMHIDGFRVDLASVLGVLESNKYSGTAEWFEDVRKSIVQDIIDDPVLQKHNVRVVAEPWDATHFGLGGFLKAKSKQGYAWSEWNGRFRDIMKGFVNYDEMLLSSETTMPPYFSDNISLGNMLLGSSRLFYEFEDNRSPYNSINYLTAHDGFTLYDVVTYTDKLNGCGKLDPVCCTNEEMCDLTSGSNDNYGRNWCNTGYTDEQTHRQESGRCDNDNNEALKRQMMRNLFALLFLSNGTPMIYGGDEIMRTLYGNNNPYGAASDNEYNWLRWDDWQNNDEALRMHSFVKNLIQIRKAHKEQLAPANYLSAPEDFTWWNPNGVSDSDVWLGKSIAMYFKQKSSSPELFVMINMETDQEKTFTLPEGEWKVLVDTQNYFDLGIYGDKPETDKKVSQNASANGLYQATGEYSIKPRTIVVFSK